MSKRPEWPIFQTQMFLPIKAELERLFHLAMHTCQPGVRLILEHPVISLVVVAGLIYCSARGYRML